MFASGLSNELLDFPHPIGSLVSGLAFLPFLFIASAFVLRSLTTGTTFNLGGWLFKRLGPSWLATRLGEQRWLSRDQSPALFWSNVLFVGVVPGGLGASSVPVVLLGLIDMVTLVRLYL